MAPQLKKKKKKILYFTYNYLTFFFLSCNHDYRFLLIRGFILSSDFYFKYQVVTHAYTEKVENNKICQKEEGRRGREGINRLRSSSIVQITPP